MEKRSHPAQTSLAGTTQAAASTFASAWRRAHLTVEERMARGRAARKEAPRSSHGRWEPAPDRPDPVALLEEQAESRVAQAGPDPVRADAGLAVHLLPGRRADHGGRSGGDPSVRGHRAVVRRRAPVELRPVRLARAADAVRHQRLRRDPPRPVGMGRQAPRGQLRDHGTRPRLHLRRPPRHRHGRGRGVPGPHAPGRRDGNPGARGTSTWRPGCCSTWSARRSGSSGSARRRPGRPSEMVAKAHTRDSTRVFAKRADDVGR